MLFYKIDLLWDNIVYLIVHDCILYELPTKDERNFIPRMLETSIARNE